MKKLIFIMAVICLAPILNSCAKKVADTGISIYGIVFDSVTNAPLKGVLLTLMPSSKNCYTGSDGTYQFEDLYAQQYTITASMAGYRTDRKTVNLLPGDREEVTFILKTE